MTGTTTARLRRIAAATTGLTGFLLVLGIYTAAAGAGLACAQRWPFCDGAVLGLFPATVPSFVEWFHRLVAMVTGFVILGFTYAVWRHGGDRRVRGAVTLATVLLPAQVLLGAETVFTYTLLSRALHFLTALTIFTALVAATARLWADSVGAAEHRLRHLLALAVVCVPLAFAFGPRGLLAYSPIVQAVSYAAGLAGYGALVAATLWLDGSGHRARLATLAAAAAVVATLVVRRLVYTDLLPLADLLATGLAVALVLAALALISRSGPTVDGTGPETVRSD